MAKLRVFVSSTCYDLGIVRSELRPFITSLGYEPVMSDYSDILYDPRSHTHESCIKEVPNCDMVVLIIGPRFGGTGIPSLLEEFDFNTLENSSSKSKILAHKNELSITQLEILKAVEKSIPVYAFVDDKVLHDHNVYEKNKDKPSVMKEIEFPSIQKRNTATYIFEFINFLTHRTTNNSVIGFSRLEDIKNTLVGQWSQLFQRLLYEDRNKTKEAKRYMDFTDSIEDLKTVVLASIATPNLRETARGAIQYRRLMSFLAAFQDEQYRNLLISDYNWNELLDKLGISKVEEIEIEKGYRPKIYLVRTDGTFYTCRFPMNFILDMEAHWMSFIDLEQETREAIVDASLQDRDLRRFRDIRHEPRQFNDFLDELRIIEDKSEDIDNI